MPKNSFLKIFYTVNLCTFLLALLNAHSFGIWLNLSSSLPYGLYRLNHQENHTKYRKGELILFCLDKKTVEQTQAYLYLDNGNCDLGLAPIGKKIVAVEGDKVNITSYGIYINGKRIKASASLLDNIKGRFAEYHNKTLQKGEYLVASELQNSFDSRYFGIVKKDWILGTIKAL